MSTESDEYYKVYEEHSKTLRTWLVAYGAGAPVLVVSNDSLWKALAGGGKIGAFASFFLIGVVAQVLLTITNKHAMWALYYGEIEPTYQQKPDYKFACWVSLQYWIDIVVDAVTVILFGIGTWVLLSVTFPPTITGASGEATPGAQAPASAPAAVHKPAP